MSCGSEESWRHAEKTLGYLGLFALVGTIAVAAVLGIAGTGKAASPNICRHRLDSDDKCVVCRAANRSPRLDRGQDAVSVTRFTNQSGAREERPRRTSSSARRSRHCRHGQGRHALRERLAGLDGRAHPASLLGRFGTATVSCPVGTIAGASSAKLVVRFSALTARTVAGSASYGEGGNDSTPPRPNGTKNDLQTSRDSFTIAWNNRTGGLTSQTAATSLAPPPRRSRRPRSARSIRRSICRALRRGAGVARSVLDPPDSSATFGSRISWRSTAVASRPSPSTRCSTCRRASSLRN